MSWLFRSPRRIVYKGGRNKTAQEILDRLRDYLNDKSAEPVELLCGFWKDQQDAITYQELRELVKTGYLDEITARLWQQDYSVLVTERLPQIWGDAIIAGSVSQPVMDGILSSFTFNTQTPGIVEWVRSRGAYLVTECTQTQKDAIALLLEDKIRNTHSVDELARLIRPCVGLTKGQASAARNYYDNLVKTLTEQHPRTKPESIQAKALERTAKYAETLHRQRAITIAHTEMAYAYNYGADEGVRQAQADYLIGRCEKRWITSGDDRVCNDCGELDGKQIGMEDLFFSGNKVEYDESGLFPPLHPRCACAVQYIEVEPPRLNPEPGNNLQPQAPRDTVAPQPQPEPQVQTGAATTGADQQQLEEKFNRPTGALNTDYRDALIDRYQAGTDTAKAVYDKYVPNGGAVDDGAYKKVPHYSPRTNSINMNFADDAKNRRGAGTTWFHEHGHYIDAQNSSTGGLSKSFRDALIRDVKAYEKAYQQANGIRLIQEARERIGDELRSYGAVSHSVQDIFGGAIKKPYPHAAWAHKASYWKGKGDTGVSLEAFAHMFEASFSPEKTDLMKKYLPSAWAEFQKILGGFI